VRVSFFLSLTVFETSFPVSFHWCASVFRYPPCLQIKNPSLGFCRQPRNFFFSLLLLDSQPASLPAESHPVKKHSGTDFSIMAEEWSPFLGVSLGSRATRLFAPFMSPTLTPKNLSEFSSPDYSTRILPGSFSPGYKHQFCYLLLSYPLLGWRGYVFRRA